MNPDLAARLAQAGDERQLRAELEALCGQYGEVESIEILPARSSPNAVVCFVRMKDDAALIRLLQDTGVPHFGYNSAAFYVELKQP